MLHKYLRLGLVTGVSLLLVAADIAARSAIAAPVPGPYVYAVKFVCGYQPPLPHTGKFGEPVVKPGNYATDINIHNPQTQPQNLQKN
jgi:hypothetical protein